MYIEGSPQTYEAARIQGIYGQCAHEACDCPVFPGQEYCSDFCKHTWVKSSATCQCAHSDCLAD